MIHDTKNDAFANLRLFACNSHPELAQEIAEHMGVELSKSTVTKFSDGEISVSIWESVRGKDCFIIQSTCGPVNDNIMELLIMSDALRRASAKSVTAVIPYFGYARQDRKAKARDPITSKLIANMITAAGVGRVITMDLHAAQEQGFFDIPVDHMLGQPMLTDYFKLKDLEDLVIVSPDHGSVTRARNMAKPFNVPIAIIDKRRPEPNKSEIMNIIGEVEGKNCVILDDMIDTAGTICNAAKALKDLGAKNVYACATHAVLSGPAVERIEASPIKEMVLLNTIPIPEEKKLKKITVLSTGHIFAETISRVYSNKPISVMFNQ
ncbi:MAG: ribose-phosphate diphosphokinase [Mogibacterium sp.]|nr:ribose-phosphate diphosphokinase [Mogibacterium sp.]